jgi:hypothetical protein
VEDWKLAGRSKVLCGSKGDVTALKCDFRYTPESGLKSDIAACLKCANIETHAPQQTTVLFDHELLRRCDDSKSSIAPILNGPKNSGLHGNVLDRRRITEQSDLRRHR